jgi:DUF917 family protein
MDLSAEMLQYLVVGGSFYGGGGGGSMETGREVGRQALKIGRPNLIDLDDLPDDSLLLTVSAVAPAGTGAHATPDDYVRAVELFQRYAHKTVSGLITNECGGLATVNGWVQSAATGLPVVDAPCNGRAHPTGAMGSMGLNQIEGYVSQQVAVGGSRANGSYLEIYIEGSVDGASGMVRKTAGQTGGLVAVARNPVSVSYAKGHAAPGAIRRCLEVGRAIVDGRANVADGRTNVSMSGRAAIEAAAQSSRGKIACVGRVAHKSIESIGGFDQGKLIIEGTGAPIELFFCNEYLTMELRGARLASFPDLITTLDLSTGLPVTSAELCQGQEVAVVVVPRDSLVLGAGMRDKRLLEDVERLTGVELVKYAFGSDHA